MTKVTVIITTYNRYDSLKEAIDSVKNQTYSNIELIVVDDGSTDEKYNELLFDSDIIYIKRKVNTRTELGFPCPGRVRNEALLISSGEYICFLDDDDYFYPQKIEKQIAAMENYDIKASCSEAHIGNGLYSSEDLISPIKYQSEFYLNYNRKLLLNTTTKDDGVFPDRISHQLICKHNVIITSSVMISKDILENDFFPEVSVFGNGKFNGKKDFEDWMMWRKLSKKSDFLWIDEPLVYYNSRGKVSNNSFIRKIMNKFRFFKL